MLRFEKLKFYQRWSLYYKSKWVAQKIKASYLFDSFTRGVQMTREGLNVVEEKQPAFSKMFYDFSQPHFFYNWAITGDREIGGDTNADGFFNKDHMLIKGELIDDKAHLLLTRLYAGMSSQFFSWINLLRFNGVRIRIKGDGNIYKLRMQVFTDLESNHAIYAFIHDKSNEWQTFELPFANFLYERVNKFEPIKMFGAYHTRFLLRNMELLTENEHGVEFQVGIKTIEFVYNPEFETLCEQYKRPYFYYPQDSYKNIRELNLGCETLFFNSARIQEGKKATNDLYDVPKNVKPNTIQERISKLKK